LGSDGEAPDICCPFPGSCVSPLRTEPPGRNPPAQPSANAHLRHPEQFVRLTEPGPHSELAGQWSALLRSPIPATCEGLYVRPRRWQATWLRPIEKSRRESPRLVCRIALLGVNGNPRALTHRRGPPTPAKARRETPQPW